jgi:hypothetical protein
MHWLDVDVRSLARSSLFLVRCRKRYNIVGRVVDLPDVVASK